MITCGSSTSRAPLASFPWPQNRQSHCRVDAFICGGGMHNPTQGDGSSEGREPQAALRMSLSLLHSCHVLQGCAVCDKARGTMKTWVCLRDMKQSKACAAWGQQTA